MSPIWIFLAFLAFSILSSLFVLVRDHQGSSSW